MSELFPVIDPSVNCEGCGACCLQMCSPPFIGRSDPEYLALPDDVRADYERGMGQRERDGWPDDVPCFWLDLKTRRCLNYEHRPEICREFVVGSEPCLNWR